jgi:hypothetical protein
MPDVLVGPGGSMESEVFLNFTKNLALWVVIGLLLLALFNLFQG